MLERRRRYGRLSAVHGAVLGRCDGSGLGGVLPKSTADDFPSSAGPDPAFVLVVRTRPETSGGIFLMSIFGAFDPKPLVATPGYDCGPHLSSDGRWLRYQSNASGQAEIHVQRYPALDRPWQMSAGACSLGEAQIVARSSIETDGRSSR